MGSNDATLTNLLAQMYQNQEVLQGWDAVMNLLESSVNQFFQYQWNQQTGSAGAMKIASVWCEGVQPLQGNYFTNVTEFSIELGPPLFQFTSGSAAVTVTQKILGGTLRLGTKTVPSTFNPSTCGCTYDDPSVAWSAPVTIDLGGNPTLSGTVALQQVQGLVNASAQSLVLDFSKGAFTLNNLSVSGVNNTDLADQLQDWFATNEIRYILASVDLQNYSGQPPSLTPSSFRFNVVTTNAGNTVVQLLITTNGSPPASQIIDVNEPVPTADGLSCSLMVSSRILFSDILAAGFNKPGASFNLVALPPASSSQIWRATIAPELVFSGSFSFGSCCDRTTVTYTIYLGGIYAGSPSSGFILTQNQSTQGNVQVNISVYASYPVALSGSGPGQQFIITPGTPTVSVTGSAEGQIKSTLEGILNTDFRNGMSGISFAPVTVFALKNLLFPGSLITMSQAQVPGDLLIVGTFAPPA